MKHLIGKQVTCKHIEQAYYSNYGGNPELFFKPGMRGVVKAVMPSVTRDRIYFAVVDYIDDTGIERRVSLLKNNIKEVMK